MTKTAQSQTQSSIVNTVQNPESRTMLILKSDLELAIAITGAAHKAVKSPLNHAMIEDGFMWVTEGHRVIKCPVQPAHEEVLSGKIFIHYNDLRAILKRGKPQKIQGLKYYAVTEVDVAPALTKDYPNVAQFLEPKIEWCSIGRKFREALFEFLHGPGFRIVEFKAKDYLHAAFHEHGQSTFPTALEHSIDEPIAQTLTEAIAFRSEYLEDLHGFPFNEGCFLPGKFAQIRLRHSKTGHEILIMGTENIGPSRHPSFNW